METPELVRQPINPLTCVTYCCSLVVSNAEAVFLVKIVLLAAFLRLLAVLHLSSAQVVQTEAAESAER